jgi:hypothetical protein
LSPGIFTRKNQNKTTGKACEFESWISELLQPQEVKRFFFGKVLTMLQLQNTTTLLLRYSYSTRGRVDGLGTKQPRVLFKYIP